MKWTDVVLICLDLELAGMAQKTYFIMFEFWHKSAGPKNVKLVYLEREMPGWVLLLAFPQGRSSQHS